jgi:hypothetical protein
MAHAMTPSVVRQIESLFDGGLVTGLSDRQLIERFVARRDAAGEAAFSALVARHGPMVLGVCRQLLGDHQLRLLLVTVLACAAIATGAGLLARSLPVKEGHVKEQAAQAPKIAPRTVVPARPPASPANAEHGRMTVAGRVLRPGGRPVVGVPVDVVGRPREPWVATSINADSHVLIGHGETDADGRFRVDAARTASGRFFEVDAVAAASGHGLGSARLNPDADQPAAEIILRPEQVIHGRVVDIKGQPAADVRIWVGRVGQFVGGTFDGVNLGDGEPLEGLRAWPRPVKSDEQGRFVLTGIGRSTPVGLVVRDPRFARQWLFLETRRSRPCSRPTQILWWLSTASTTGMARGPTPTAGSRCPT